MLVLLELRVTLYACYTFGVTRVENFTRRNCPSSFVGEIFRLMVSWIQIFEYPF